MCRTRAGHNPLCPLDRRTDLLTFVARECGVCLNELTPTTRLNHDLGLDGDDAGEFFEAFFARYHVDPTGFDFYAHFGPEGCFPLLFWRPTPWHGKPMNLPVTVGDLSEAAEAERWPGHRFALPAFGRGDQEAV